MTATTETLPNPMGGAWETSAMTAFDLAAKIQDDFDDLWCYIWGKLELDDRDSQAMARRLNNQGISTWVQWCELGCPAA
jgi:hypothetical protein